LDDAVGLSLGEALQCRGERLGRRDVDGRVRELAALGAVDQLGVDLRGGDGHIGMLLLRERGQGVIRFKSVTSALGPSGTSRPPAASPPTTACTSPSRRAGPLDDDVPPSYGLSPNAPSPNAVVVSLGRCGCAVRGRGA